MKIAYLHLRASWNCWKLAKNPMKRRSLDGSGSTRKNMKRFIEKQLSVAGNVKTDLILWIHNAFIACVQESVEYLPQIKIMYLSGIKYKTTVAAARNKQARIERKGTVQFNVL